MICFNLHRFQSPTAGVELLPFVAVVVKKFFFFVIDYRRNKLSYSGKHVVFIVFR